MAGCYTYDGTISERPPKPDCTTTDKPLEGGDLRWFRVIPLNKKTNGSAKPRYRWLDCDQTDAAGSPVHRDGRRRCTGPVLTPPLNAYGMTGNFDGAQRAHRAWWRKPPRMSTPC